MITLILIGGNSRRFHEAGIDTPKALLPMPAGAGAANMLTAILDTLNQPAPIILAGREEMRGAWDWPDVWRRQRLTYVWGGGAAGGPLAGLIDAAPYLLRSKESLLVSYCDVLFPMGATHILRHWRGCHSGAVLFRSEDPRFGYWDKGRVWEKRVRGHWAVSGLFYFRSAADTVLRAVKARAPGAGLPSLLDWRTKMYRVQGLELLDLGTPQDYTRFMSEAVRG